jgi:asparagine synthase (glutamine-hydrolysing)
VREKLNDLVQTDGSQLQLCLGRRRTFSNGQLYRLGLRENGEIPSGLIAEEAAVHCPTDPEDVIASVSRIEATFYLGNMLLRDSDVFGMANSLEIRVPMLDTELVNLVMRIPGAIRLPSGKPNKQLLRQCFSRMLPRGAAKERKRGFELPISQWMAGPLRDWCKESLTYLDDSGFVEKGPAWEYWESFRQEPGTPFWSRVWSLCVLGHFLRTLQA